MGERLLVVPQWMTVDDLQGRLPVILDLGLTFGTGEHASTQLCMRALESLLHGGERVADLGSGSGILSVSALRLGAASAVGVDIDPSAEHIAAANAAQNGFGPDRFTARTGDVVEDADFLQALAGDGFDIVRQHRGRCHHPSCARCAEAHAAGCGVRLQRHPHDAGGRRARGARGGRAGDRPCGARG